MPKACVTFQAACSLVKAGANARLKFNAFHFGSFSITVAVEAKALTDMPKIQIHCLLLRKSRINQGISMLLFWDDNISCVGERPNNVLSVVYMSPRLPRETSKW